MKTPFLWIALGFSIGIALEKYESLPFVWLACALGGGITVLWFLRARRLFLPIFIILLTCAGMLWARLDAYVPRNAIQNFTDSGRVILRGVVDALPEVKAGKKEYGDFGPCRTVDLQNGNGPVEIFSGEWRSTNLPDPVTGTAASRR